MTDTTSEIPDHVKNTFKQAIDGAGDSRAVVIVTLGDEIDVFTSRPTISELIVMHRIFSDWVETQVRENTT